MTARFVHPFFDVGSGLTPSDGAKLTFKNPGLETLKNTFSDSTGLTPNANPVVADATGLFSNIYIKGNYDVVLQDKNNVQIWADPVSEFAVTTETTQSFATITLSITKQLTIGDTVQTLGYTTAGDGGAGLYEVVASGTGTDDGGAFINSNPSGSFQLKLITTEPNFKQWGSFGDNSTDDILTNQACINANLGNRILANQGTYKHSDELLIPFNTGNSTHVYGVERNGSKIILTGVSNKACIRLSASNCTIEHLGIAGDAGQTGNSGIRIAPESETQTTERVANDHNVIQYVDVSGTFEFGIVLRPGPDVGGPDSSCFFNLLNKIKFVGDVNVGIYLLAGVNAASSPANRNQIEWCRFEGSMNVGIWNAGANTTHINNCNFEGVKENTSPKAIPTAVVIEDLASTGASNQNVTLLNCKFENNSRDIENANSRTEIYSCNIDSANCLFTVQPQILIGGTDFSTTTQHLPGYKHQTASVTDGIPNGSPVMNDGLFLSSDSSKLAFYEEGTFLPSVTGNATPPVVEKSELTTIADVNNSLDGKFFQLQDGAATNFFVWISTSGGSATVPAGTGNPIEANPATDGSAMEVGRAIRAALDNESSFEASNVGSLVTYSNTATGIAANTVDVDTGFSFTTLQGGTVDEGQTYSKRLGRFSRIGNRVTFDIRFRMSSLGSMTTTETARIGGLPYVALSLTDYEATVVAGASRQLNLTAASMVTGTIPSNASIISLKNWDGTDTPTALTLAELSADGDLTLSGSYEV